VDLIINAIQTIALAVTWFMSRNHLLGEPQPDQGGDSTPISDEVRQGFEFEGGISILILLSLWCLHVCTPCRNWLLEMDHVSQLSGLSNRALALSPQIALLCACGVVLFLLVDPSLRPSYQHGRWCHELWIGFNTHDVPSQSRSGSWKAYCASQRGRRRIHLSQF